MLKMVSAPCEGPLARVARRGTKLFFDTQQLVVLGQAIRAESEPVLIWPQFVATAKSAMVASSVSPDRWDYTPKSARAAISTASNVSDKVPI